VLRRRGAEPSAAAESGPSREAGRWLAINCLVFRAPVAGALRTAFRFASPSVRVDGQPLSGVRMMAGTKRPQQTSNDVEFLPDELAEEERIMSERAAKLRTLDSQTLKVPIRTLPLAKAITVPQSATIQQAIEGMQTNK